MSKLPGLLLLILVANFQEESKFEELRKLRRERRVKTGAEAEAAAKSIQALLPDIVRPLLETLKTGAPETVAATTARLAEIGSPAVPGLEALAKEGSPDARARAAAALKLTRHVEAEDDGLWKQWASEGKASSEYDGQGKTNAADWSAKRACGKPDTDEAGDHPTAWATHDPDGGEEWLELMYRFPVRPARVRIHETFNPGAVVRIEALDGDKKWRALWKGTDSTTDCPGVLDVAVDVPAFSTRAIRITLDTSAVEGWNEIDAVQLIGEPSGDPVQVADIPEPEPVRGTVRVTQFDSRHIGDKRTVRVWLPPGHDPKKSYPVFYTCDGMLNVDMKLVEPLIADGRIPPIIVVAIMHGPNLRMQEYVQTGSKAFAAHEKWFIEEVLPWAEKEYGASKAAGERIVFGSSNGGPFSLTMGARHPELFGHVVGAMVYALNLPKWKSELAETPKEKQRYVLYAGSRDANGVRENAGAESVLKERGYPVTSVTIEGGGHTNQLNREMLPKVLEDAWGKKKMKEF